MRARPPQGRSTFLAFILLAAAATPVLGSSGTSAPEAPVPREQIPGEASGFRLPFDAGIEVPIAQGWDTGYSHNGRSTYAYDFGLYSGTPVRAAASGVVAFTHEGEQACGGPEMKNRANYVTIDHPDGSATAYGHLSTVDVEVGDVVSSGQFIGRSGDTGYTSCMPHLHFARQLQGEGVARSIPVYFEGYEDVELRTGDRVRSAPVCTRDVSEASEADLVTEGFCAMYFRGEFDGPALFSRGEETVDVDLADGALGGYWLDEPGPYSARWVGRFGFAPSWYAFRVDATGGVRLKVDGVVKLDEWADHQLRRQREVRVRMQPGIHTIELEHYTTHPTDRVGLDWAPLRSDR